MKKLSGNEIRALWLKFFESKGHHVEPSSSLVPKNDPTLLWINSGVAALKKYFDGSVVPEFKRITNAQKCIRTNDIESVGLTARHHTFFEMLGNFSIGDYFRESIIPWALEILTSPDYFALDQDRIYMTYYPTDLETRDLWLKIGVKADHLIPLEGNFWEIGAGPSGPNTEIFFDRGPKYDPKGRGLQLLINDEENDRYIEIWGIVFSQFNANPALPRSEYPLLPNKNVDTGAGLERIACVLQETETNFETDLFSPILDELKKLTNEKYEGDNLISFRIIMDHVRTLVFALSDGAYFEATGRGYVLRRLLRRALIQGDKLKIKPPFLSKLVDTVVNNMGGFYTNLVEQKERVKKEIKAEEEKFLTTLKNGKETLIRVSGESKALNGQQLFTLYDTYGLPLDLSLDFAMQLGIKVDTNGFNELLEAQKERARASRNVIDSMNKQSEDLLKFDLPSTFTYSRKHLDATVIGIFQDGVKVNSLKEGESGEIILDQTNFYAESGGQIYDTGLIQNEETLLDVTNTQKAPNGQHLHFVKVSKGVVQTGDALKVIIDRVRRLKITRNHSATHMLQAALNEVLGGEIHQLGSLVNDEYLRFDFSFERKLTNEELSKIEAKVNEYINNAYKGVIQYTTLARALELGAIAEFGDKYDPNNVRLVSFGSISRELCGGCHVDNTEDIGIFVLESEQGIAAGTRRIQATTSHGVYLRYLENLKFEDEIGALLNAKSQNETKQKLVSLQESYQLLLEENRSFADKFANMNAKNIENEAIVKDGVSYIIARLDGINKNNLIKVSDDLKSKYQDSFILLLGIDNGSVNIVSSASNKAIAQGFKANDVVKEVTGKLEGRGGGKDAFAQGSASNLEKINEVIKELKERI